MKTENKTDSRTPVPTTNGDDFSKYIKKKQKSTLNPTTLRRWSTQELAKALTFGDEYDRFRKIVNMSRPTQKRDVIIAICIVLQMSIEEANYALNLYNMSTLDSTIERDKIFIQILDNKQAKSFEKNTSGMIDYVDNIDTLLRSHGCNTLDLHKQTLHVPYKPVKLTTSNLSEDIIFYGPEYNSLSAKYCLDSYRYKSSLLLENQDNKHRLIISVTLSINEYTYWIEREADGRIERFDPSSGDRALIPFVKGVHHAAKNKLYSLLRILDDTKNYRFREGACFKDGTIHFYLESFNYLIPELNEYCTIEKSGNELSLNVYNQSEFIYHHIGAEEYNRVFGYREHKPLHTFSSIDDLSEKTSCKPYETDPIHYSAWQSIFKELLEKLGKLNDDLKNHHECIRSIDELDDSGISVCEYYKVEREYECKRDTNGVVQPNRTYASIKVNGIPQTEISIEDLRLAYQLGIPDIQSVCRAKADFGTIWDIFT